MLVISYTIILVALRQHTSSNLILRIVLGLVVLHDVKIDFKTSAMKYLSCIGGRIESLFHSHATFLRLCRRSLIPQQGQSV